MDAGAWFDAAFSGERIPFLEEVFATLGKRTEYELELKGCTEEFFRAVLKLARLHDLLGHIELTSPHPYLLTYLKRQCPEAKIGMFIAPPPEWMDAELWKTLTAQHAVLGSIDVVHIPVRLLDANFVKTLHEHGLRVHAADCDTPEELAAARKCGADQCSTRALDIVQ